jgi:OmpA-OmpF porin, OOP family
MKTKSIFLSILLAQSITFAQSHDYTFTPLIGVNLYENDFTLDNQMLGGAQLQLDRFKKWGISPELMALYTLTSDYSRVEGASTCVTKVGLNGVYDFFDDAAFTPFIKAGAGYQFLYKYYDGNTDGMFLDAGTGLKYAFSENLALKLEGLYLVKFRDEPNYKSDFDNNFIAMAGLSYSFGGGASETLEEVPQSAPVAATPAAIVESDNDNDGVVDSKDRCEHTPQGAEVDAFGCVADNDKDGVYNSKDKCPDTHAWADVDADGCAIKMSVHINFAFDSANIPEEKATEIDAFAEFLKKQPYNVRITGHSDAKGEHAYNMELSTHRAESLMKALIKRGIEPQRLKATGKGENEPIASNETEEGQAANRRIEIELLEPKQ